MRPSVRGKGGQTFRRHLVKGNEGKWGRPAMSSETRRHLSLVNKSRNLRQSSRREHERQKSESSLVVVGGGGGDSVTQRENFIFCARVAGGPRSERMNDLSVRVEAARSSSQRPQNGYEAEERTKLYLAVHRGRTYAKQGYQSLDALFCCGPYLAD